MRSRARESLWAKKVPGQCGQPYPYRCCKDNGADGDIQNWEGHPAKFGIDGDKDPSDPCNLLEQATSTQEAMDALDAMLHRDGLDRAQVAMLGMQVKKGNKALAKADWTPECQAKLADVIKALD